MLFSQVREEILHVHVERVRDVEDELEAGFLRAFLDAGQVGMAREAEHAREHSLGDALLFAASRDGGTDSPISLRIRTHAQ